MEDGKDKEPIKIEFSCKFTKKKSLYDHDTILEVDFKETVPPKEDVVKYVKLRIAEEINRQKATFDAYQGLAKEKIELDPLLTDF